jgi:hypothetical protein
MVVHAHELVDARGGDGGVALRFGGDRREEGANAGNGNKLGQLWRLPGRTHGLLVSVRVPGGGHDLVLSATKPRPRWPSGLHRRLTARIGHLISPKRARISERCI